MRYLIGFLTFSLYSYGFNYHLKPYEISNGIDCFFGIPSQVSEINGGNMINSCYIETPEGYVVIDSGPTYSYAQEAYEVMKKKKNLIVKYVINTSWDEVHVLGNEFYKELGAKILGPKGYKKYLETKKELFLEKRLSKDAFINTRIVSLDKYIEKEELLKIGDMKLFIKLLDGDSNHLYIYLKEKNIIFVGDLIFNNQIVPINNGRSLNGWLKEIEKLSVLKWSDLISAHGYMTRRSALKNTKTYLSLLKEGVSKGIENNKTVEELTKVLAFDDFKAMKFYDIWHRKNVIKVYDELTKLKKQKRMKVDEKRVVKKKEREKESLPRVTNIVKKNEVVGKKIVKKEILKKKILKKPVEKKPVKKKPVVKKEIIHIRYQSFSEAMKMAKKDKKIVLIKARSTVCKYCDQLERIFVENTKVEKILNRYFELVVLNIDDETLPLDLNVRSTPTLIFIRPDNQKVLMQLAGIRALGELIEILNEAVEDGHLGAYLKP